MREYPSERVNESCESTIIPVIGGLSVTKDGMRHFSKRPFDVLPGPKGSLTFDDGPVSLPVLNALLPLCRIRDITLKMIFIIPSCSNSQSYDLKFVTQHEFRDCA